MTAQNLIIHLFFICFYGILFVFIGLLHKKKIFLTQLIKNKHTFVFKKRSDFIQDIFTALNIPFSSTAVNSNEDKIKLDNQLFLQLMSVTAINKVEHTPKELILWVDKTSLLPDIKKLEEQWKHLLEIHVTINV